MESKSMEKTKRHNGVISFWKFAFMMMIAIHHFALAYADDSVTFLNYSRWAGVIGVTFFFVVSGYLMTKTALKIHAGRGATTDLGKTTWQFLFKKVKRFFPYALLAYLIVVAYLVFAHKINGTQVINSVWNMSFLTMSGVRFTIIIDIIWYVSAMLICMLILFPLIVKYGKNFIMLICPVLAIFMIGYLSQKYNGLATIYQYNGLFYDGMVRAMACMMCGSFAYLFAEMISKRKMSFAMRLLLTIIEIVGFAGMFVLADVSKTDSSILELAILMGCISIAFSGKTLLLGVLSNGFVFFLEALTLSILFMHRAAIKIPDYSVFGDNYYLKLAVYVLITVAISLVAMGLVKLGGYLVERRRKRALVKR